MTLSRKAALIALLWSLPFSFCLSQDVTLNSQADVDAFDSSITTINGDLTIIDVFPPLDPITDLSNLSSITTIEGNLEITSLDVITNVDYFSNLSYVEGRVNIQHNDNLLDLDGFSSLTFIGHNLSISSNDVLISVDGFANLTTVNGSLWIAHNPVLVNLDGFLNISSIAYNLTIQNNVQLIDVNGLGNVSYIGGWISLSDNEVLSSLDAFSGISTVFSNLLIRNNNSLSNLNGLSAITSIGGGLRIGDNDALTNIDALENLTAVETFIGIDGNQNLLDLDGLAALAFVGGNFTVANNESLTDCCAIQDLLSYPSGVAGDVNIYDNPSACSSVSEVLMTLCDIEVLVVDPCIGADNGLIELWLSDLSLAPYTYTLERIEDGQVLTENSNEHNFVFDNLSAGTYNLTATDAAGVSYTREGLVLSALQGSVFEFFEITTTNSSNNQSNGAIHIVLSGGTAPFAVTWSGTSSGMQAGLAAPVCTIPLLAQGEYEIIISDDVGNQQITSITLLDETVPVFPCTQPLDIVILNDVSGSVDEIEYDESKEFFVDFLNAANIGMNADESRAAIIEWSSGLTQDVRIPMTGDLTVLQDYVDYDRLFSGGTHPQQALVFGENYLASVARPEVEKVLILSTDGAGDQISPSLVGLADQYKAAGYHIITIAFDNAFFNENTRNILRQVASLDLLAPGAPAYSLLDEDLAEYIVNLYLCPIDPGSSATVYFDRDGVLEIIDLAPTNDCPFPESVDLTFTVEALQELSIPPGTPVTFYYNDPALYGATPILTWQMPCSIPVGTTETFTVNLPVMSAANIFVVLNDDGSQAPPIALPVTDIDELAYSNNIDNIEICTDPLPTLQALKYTTTPTPICNDIVIYTIDVCNITDLDAGSVSISDDAPDGFELLHTVINDNGCSTDNGDSFDIPANCCLSITYTYDAGNAANANYNDQDVHLSGPDNQIYIDFDGAFTAVEDVLIDGTIDCPSTVVNFTKEVNVTDICEDAFVVYTFTIDNQLLVPIQGLYFTDILPDPVTWVFQPYNLDGLSISHSTLEGGSATFVIDEVAANTVATFSLDAALGDWVVDGTLINTASLDNIPDLENGGIVTLHSNSVTTNVTTSPEIEVSQSFDCSNNSIALTAASTGEGDTNWSWVSVGDGTFSDNTAASTIYMLGEEDLINGETTLLLAGNSDCGEANETVEIRFEKPEAVSVNLSSCEGQTLEYEGTILSIGDTQEFILENSAGCDSIVVVTVGALPNSASILMLETCGGETIDYEGISLSVGDSEDFVFQNSLGCDSIVSVTVQALPQSTENLVLEACEGETVDYHGMAIPTGETEVFGFQNAEGCDSLVTVSVVSLPTSHEELEIEACEGEPVLYNEKLISVGEEALFTFENNYGCDSIITVRVVGRGGEAAHGVPNIFSPNNDGINDCFQPYFANDFGLQNYKLQVYNRWGGLVYSTNDPYDCWDGRFNNKPANNGIYVWFMELTTADCQAASFSSGDVMLIR